MIFILFIYFFDNIDYLTTTIPWSLQSSMAHHGSFFKWLISPASCPCHKLFRRLPHSAYHSKKNWKSIRWHKGNEDAYYRSRTFLFSSSALFIPRLTGVTPAQLAMTNTVNHTRLTSDKPQISTHIQIFLTPEDLETGVGQSGVSVSFLERGQNRISTSHLPSSSDRPS